MSAPTAIVPRSAREPEPQGRVNAAHGVRARRFGASARASRAARARCRDRPERGLLAVVDRRDGNPRDLEAGARRRAQVVRLRLVAAGCERGALEGVEPEEAHAVLRVGHGGR